MRLVCVTLILGQLQKRDYYYNFKIPTDEYYNESDGEQAVDDEEEVVQEPEEDA